MEILLLDFGFWILDFNYSGFQITHTFLEGTNLFEYAPNKIVLTGSYGFEDGEDMDSGRYEKLVYDKKDMLANSPYSDL